MKRAEMGGGQEPGVAEVADPVIADNYALVKVFSAPLCTEFKHRDRARRGGFGHEAAGEVVAVGPKVRGIAVGDRVVVMPQNGCGTCDLCREGEHIYCQSPRNALQICGSTTGRETVAQYVIQQDWLLVPIPADISYDHAAMACCGFGPGFNAMESMGVAAGDTVLVSGLGPVGLGAAAVALYRGARVAGVEPSVYRRELAQRMGVEAVFDPTENVGQTFQYGVHVTRSEEAAQALIRLIRPRGKVAFIGQGGTVDIAAVVGKGLRLYGCWHWNHARYTEQMMATIRGSAERIDALITHTFPLDRIREAFEVQVAGNCGKVVIHPWA